MVGALPDMFRSVCWSWSCRSRTQPPVCNSVGVDFNTHHRSPFFRGLNLVSVDVARLLDGRDRRPTACDRLKLDLGSEAVADFAAETAEDNCHKRKQWSVRKKKLKHAIGLFLFVDWCYFSQWLSPYGRSTKGKTIVNVHGIVRFSHFHSWFAHLIEGSTSTQPPALPVGSRRSWRVIARVLYRSRVAFLCR